MTIRDADYWMVRRDTGRCILLSHERGVIVANKDRDVRGDEERWDLLVRLDGEEIHDESHDVSDKSDLWKMIESYGEKFEAE